MLKHGHRCNSKHPQDYQKKNSRALSAKSCPADFKIDTDDFEYNDGFADFDISFEYECVDWDQQINRLTLEFSLSEYIDQVEDLLDITEDMVEYFCDEQGASGQRVWTMLHSLSEYKISEFPEY